MYSLPLFVFESWLYWLPWFDIAMIWRWCVLISITLSLSLLKVLIIVALFLTLANLKQFVFKTIMCLLIVVIDKPRLNKSILKIEPTTIILTISSKQKNRS